MLSHQPHYLKKTRGLQHPDSPSKLYLLVCGSQYQYFKMMHSVGLLLHEVCPALHMCLALQAWSNTIYYVILQYVCCPSVHSLRSIQGSIQIQYTPTPHNLAQLTARKILLIKPSFCIKTSNVVFFTSMIVALSSMGPKSQTGETIKSIIAGKHQPKSILIYV